MPFNQIIKYSMISLWVAFALSAVVTYLYDPSLFSATAIAQFLQEYDQQMMALYLVISILRGFSLLPSTPFIIAGTIIFMDQALTTFLLSIIGISLSSTLIYFFADYFGFSHFFEKKFPQKMTKVQQVLQQRSAGMFIFIWSFIPIVPTDLISYVAGSMKMNFKQFILPLMLGESILIASIIYLSKAVSGAT